MLRTGRYVYYIGIVLVFTLLFFLVSRRQHAPAVDPDVRSSGLKQQPEHALFPPKHNQPKPAPAGQDPSKRYLTWLPHGDFAEQHEAFRNAIRIAYETKRIIIAPPLRVGHYYPWQPFHQLEQRREAQRDKALLRQLCRTDTQDWRSEAEPCETLDEWTEVDWADLFDLEPLATQFGIEIIQQLPEELQDGTVRPVVLDPTSFAGNGSNVEHDDIIIQPTILTGPLKQYVSSDTLQALDNEPFLLLGSLTSSARYKTRSSKGQSALKQALTRRVFVTPDHWPPLTAAASAIMAALGGRGQYSSLHLTLDEPISLQKMEGIVLEIFGDIPINQAVSAAMPILKQSRLADLVSDNAHGPELLEACVEYRRLSDKRYPVYYLANNIADDARTRMDVFGPLYEAFPCMFTKSDLMKWGFLDVHWARSIPPDGGVVMERVLAPILDILVGTKSYSFFEIPQTQVTRFMSWQPKQ
ncbi:hypothetical protein BX666DRAFT_1995632 [Dichotomocladium elegans]|nr:hypothetical protein BX666DRAFT_1995632 [Dichotomocladium elegans]